MPVPRFMRNAIGEPVKRLDGTTLLVTDTAELTRITQRFDAIALNVWHDDIAAALKAIRPGFRCYAYQNLSLMANYGTGDFVTGTRSTGVSQQEAAATPALAAANDTGAPIAVDDFAGLFVGDPGAAAYQSLWLSNVLGRMAHYGGTAVWDGLLLDDVNATMKYHLTSASTVAQITLPQATIQVTTLSAKFLPGGGTLNIGGQIVTYTGITGTGANQSFTGCTGGTGTFSANQTVRKAPLTAYRDDASWQAGMTALIGAVVPGLKGAGYEVLPNLSSVWSEVDPYTIVCDAWAATCDGGMNEFVSKFDFASAGASRYYVADRIARAHASMVNQEAAGRRFVYSQPSLAADPGGALYGLAGYLLYATPAGKSLYCFSHDYNGEWWQDDFDAARNLGAPTGAAYAVGAGIRRDFANGAVLYNPDDSATVAFALGGYYRDLYGVAPHVLLPPKTARIMRSIPGGYRSAARLALAA